MIRDPAQTARSPGVSGNTCEWHDVDLTSSFGVKEESKERTRVSKVEILADLDR